MAENQPIIVKKVKKGGHGHHGGAWKLAYADFVTAMMAFFLLMWLLGTTDPSYRQGIAEYFKDPWKPSVAGGANTGDATSIIKGGGEDLTQSEGQVKLTNKGKQDITAEAGESEEAQNEKDLERKDQAQLEALEQKIENMIETDPLLLPYENQLQIDITEDGLRIQIIDEEGRPMFESASARMAGYAAQILHEIAPVINELPNKISIAGHTDAKPFPGGGQGYSNWELSADRANSARKELIRGGLKEDKMMRVVGLSSSVPLVKDDSLHATNRRISITVMNKHTADEITEGDGSMNVSAQKPLNMQALEAAKEAAKAAAHPPRRRRPRPRACPAR
ncbi:chemotaxis protein MotB [Methylomagnum ishizawai]|uniref:Chemotaxis protein MotB n=1 Tax=Methylomagnum ishizawai TaxID=1760988 RepID=A0A1Y6D0L5_9GAMM|nr:flagellar motor protein MotB [Methylomagnum ishizawai]SMF96478.1 chemotaxis protein MotB [Methylomagnum ishizawai]